MRAWRVEVDGYSGELGEDLRWVWRNPRGRELKQVPAVLAGRPELVRMRRMRDRVKAHREECRELAREWALTGAGVAAELAESDPVWGEALAETGVTLLEEGAAEDGGLVARVYAHAVTGWRIVRVMPEDLAPYRDKVMAHDEWERVAGFATGVPAADDDQITELPFPERALAAHPGMEQVVLEEAERLLEAGLYKKYTDVFFKELEKSRPELLPLFLDAAAERYLDSTYDADREPAAAYFGRARKAEREQARKMDQAWLEARYARFAEAGALPTAALRARAKEVSAKGVATPERAVAFREIAMRRAAHPEGGVYAQLAGDVRKVAKAAGLDPEEELATFLADAELVGRTKLHDDAFWADVLKGRAFDLLCARQPEVVCAQLLGLRPNHWKERNRLWRDLLERSGTLARLCGETPGVTAVEAARWLSACVYVGRDLVGLGEVLLGVAARVAPRLAAEGVPVEIRFDRERPSAMRKLPLDVIDVLLEHGVSLTDPPARLGDPKMYELVVEHRPDLRHLCADPRYGGELRALLRAVLDLTSERSERNSWYQPQESKGWGVLPVPYANDLGRAVLREWCADERARLRAGVDLTGLTLLLGRFVQAGNAVGAELKSAEAAAEFAAVDVVGLLMDELPGEVDRADLEKLLTDVPDASLSATRPQAPVMDVVERLWPGLEREDAWRIGGLLQTAVNCRVGLARVVRSFTPEGPEGPEGPEHRTATDRPDTGLVRVCAELVELAGSDTPVWSGDPYSHSADLGLDQAARALLSLHAFTARATLAFAGSLRPRWAPAAQDYADYARLPFVAGYDTGTDGAREGHWRAVRSGAPADMRALCLGWAVRTDTSAAVVVGADAQGRTLVEYAPTGEFAVDRVLSAVGIEQAEDEPLRPARPAAWYARFAELRQERGPVPARPELAGRFAELLGVSPAEATVLLAAHVDCTPHQLGVRNPVLPPWDWAETNWKLRRTEYEAALEGLTGLLDPGDLAGFYDRLLPDDPERLWTDGPDIDRAAAWWHSHHGAPLPVPVDLLPLAGKEFTRPKGEHAVAADRKGPHRMWWPTLRPAVLLGRVAAGAAALTEASSARADTSPPRGAGNHATSPHRPAAGLAASPTPRFSPLAGAPDLLGLARAAVWTAYRTPAGDPLRPAVGAAIGRMRAAVAAGTGPLTVFSVQSNSLMGAPASIESLGLDAHPAVSWEDVPEYLSLRHIRVDPAALTGADDPLLDRLDAYLDSVLPSQWLPASHGLPGLVDLRTLLSADFEALGEHLAADSAADSAADPTVGEGRLTGWEQDPSRSVPHLVDTCRTEYGLGADAAALYLMILALPDPTDRNVRQWTAWKPARFKAAHAELAGSGRVVRADRARAGRTLFLPGAWQETKAPRLPVERAKFRLLPHAREHRSTAHTAVVPTMPVPVLFERAWAHSRKG